MRSRSILALAVGTLLCGCAPGSLLREAVRPSSPYEHYAESLREAGLDRTALGLTENTTATLTFPVEGREDHSS